MGSAAPDAGSSALPSGTTNFRLRLDGAAIMLESAGEQALYYFTCRDAIGLERLTNDGWQPLRDDRPKPFATAMFYLDDRFIGPAVTVGCGPSYCSALEPTTFVARAVEYVMIGSAEAPVASGVESGTIVPVLETRPVYGDIRALVRYSTDPRCTTSHDAAVAFAIDTFEGVCCDIGTEGCGTQAARGGWAVDEQACRGWLTTTDTYHEQLIDGYGCPTLVENTSVCCGCEDAGVP